MRTIGVSASGQPVGEFAPASKLTFADVEEMRRLRADGLTYTEIAKQFGVWIGTASRAIRGITWSTPIVRMVQQIEAEDVVELSEGEGRKLLATKAGATQGSAARAMEKAGIAWDGKHRKLKQTHCMQGHALAGENLHVRKNGRQLCKECARQGYFRRKSNAA